MDPINIKTELTKDELCEDQELPEELKQIWSQEADIAFNSETSKDLIENLKLDYEISNIKQIDQNEPTNSQNTVSTESVEVKNNHDEKEQKESSRISDKKTKPHTTKTYKSDHSDKLCPVCEYMAPSASALQAHLFVHSDVKRFQCVKCEKGFNIKRSLDAHVLKHHKDEFEDLSQVLTHKVLKCSVCDFETVGVKAFKRHFLKVHEGYEFEKKYKCELCDYHSHQKSNVTHHQLIHTGIKLYNCTFCEKGYNVKVRLEDHVLRFHKHECENLLEIVTHKILACDKCPFETVDSLSLRRHVLVHGGVFSDLELLRCMNCSYTTYSKKKLECHVQQHLKTKFHKCPECEKSYTSKLSRDYHVMKLHSTEKPELLESITRKIFKCERCNDIFRKSIELQKHQRRCVDF